MSCCGYSVEQDWEVQEYNKRRAAWKAEEKKRKEEEKLIREHKTAGHWGALRAMGHDVPQGKLSRRSWDRHTEGRD